MTNNENRSKNRAYHQKQNKIKQRPETKRAAKTIDKE